MTSQKSESGHKLMSKTGLRDQVFQNFKVSHRLSKITTLMDKDCCHLQKMSSKTHVLSVLKVWVVVRT